MAVEALERRLFRPETEARPAVPFGEQLSAFVRSGQEHDIWPSDDELCLVETMMGELVQRGRWAWAISKFGWTGALARAGAPEIHGVNNQVRRWFGFHGPTGDEGVAYSPGVMAVYAREWDYPISDVDIRVEGLSEGELETIVQERSKRAAVSSGKRVIIPSDRRPNIAVQVRPNRHWYADVRLDVSAVCEGQESTRVDRRWAGVNRLQQIRGEIVMRNSGLHVVYDPRDLAMTMDEPDSYYPLADDPLDKVAVTVSRMLVAAGMRQQIGLIARHFDPSEMLWWDSVESVAAVLEDKRQRGEVISAAATQEVLANLAVTAVVEPTMVRMVGAFRLNSFLPEHWRRVDWQRLENTHIPSSKIDPDRHMWDVTSPVALVGELVGDDTMHARVLQSSPEERIDANVAALNWIFTGQFGPIGFFDASDVSVDIGEKSYSSLA